MEKLKKLWVLIAVIAVSVGVAITYHYFESAVHHSITYVWDTWLGTEDSRWVVIPVCLILSLVFFGVQHYLDPASEKHESHGLGDAPAPTAINFIKVLFIGFFSLLAGASLGPEAILVPACMILGGYVGTKLFKKDAQVVKLLTMAGFIALFAAFFNSFIAGMLALLLVTKQVKTKLSAILIIVAVLASATTVYTLSLLSSSAYLGLPSYTWRLNVVDIVAITVLLVAGYGVTYAIGILHGRVKQVQKLIAKSSWWMRGLAAAVGLSAIYLLGGSLVEFTGNESIVPMLHKASSLGLIGLAWIVIIKLIAISWSKAMGYRGGLIFPTIFVASVLVAITQLVSKDINFIYGLIAVMVGVIAANTKVKILF